MNLFLRKILSLNIVIYFLIGILLSSFFDFRQARIQRLYELNRLKAYWENIFKGHEVRADTVDEAALRTSLRYFKLMSQAFPERVRAEEMRGLCYVLLGDDQRAIRSFDILLKQRPHFFWVEFEKGRALYRLGKWPQALEAFYHIAAYSDEDLKKAAMLSSIMLLSPAQRVLFMPSLNVFISKIKEANRQMILRCLLQQDQKENALMVAINAVKDPAVLFPAYFQAYALILSRKDDMKIVPWVQEDLAVDQSVLGVHPWHLFIPSVRQPW